MCALLVSLGKFQCIDAISNFFSPEDVGRFDSAFCSRLYRRKYLSYFDDKNVLLDTGDNFILRKTVAKWLFSKKIILRTLRLNNRLLSDSTISQGIISPYTNSISLTRCSEMGGLSFKELLHACTRLTTLRITQSDFITDDILIPIIQSNPNLTECNFHCLKHITDMTVCALADNCPNLGSLNLIDCGLLTSTGFVSLANHCHKITELHAPSLEGTDLQLTKLYERCTSLTSPSVDVDFLPHTLLRLNLSNRMVPPKAPHISNDYILSITSSRCINLTVLNINGTYGITDSGILSLCQGCRNLRELSMRSPFNHSLLPYTYVAYYLRSLEYFETSKLKPDILRVFAIIIDSFESLTVLDVINCRIGGIPKKAMPLLKTTADGTATVIPERDKMTLDEYIVYAKGLAAIPIGTDVNSIHPYLTKCYHTLTTLAINYIDTATTVNKRVALSYANLTSSYNVLGSDLLQLSNTCTTLIDVTFHKLRCINDDVFAALIRQSPTLKRVSFNSCALLTDNTVTLLADTCCKSLCEFSCIHNTLVTYKSLLYLLKHCHKFVQLTLSHSDSFTIDVTYAAERHDVELVYLS